MHIWEIILIATAIVAIATLIIRHQISLKRRAYLMREAINNRDYSFKLSTSGLLFGDKAMQQALNAMGEIIKEQSNRSEVDSWRNLSRVLTHEIMNTTAPIASISQALLNQEEIKGTRTEKGLETINTAVHHLNVCIESYRKMSQLDDPNCSLFPADEFFKQITSLFTQVNWNIENKNVSSLFADQTMLHQAVVNIVKNAVEAKAKNIGIKIDMTTTDDKKKYTDIYISNDGTTIPPDIAKIIFIPFFTTKSYGTGIGLALCRQIIVTLGGDIELTDSPYANYNTTFRVRLPYKGK
jgi:signal transduction histidine kinase